MKSIYAFLRLRRIFILIFIFCATNSLLHAQAPVITVKSGMPTGNQTCFGVAYGNGVYVAVFNGGKIYKSADGSDWAKVPNTNLHAGYNYRLKFAAGLFVMVMSDGHIATSADGVTWTSRTSGTTSHFYDLNFLQGAFYAVGDNRTVAKSTDGITWSLVTVNGGVAGYFNSITYGNGYFVIAARNSTGMNLGVYRSATAASNSWTFQTLSYELVNRVQYLKNKFYIFTSGTAVWTSTDAGTWTNTTASMPLTLPNATVQNIGTPNQAFHGVYDGTKVYLYGSTQYYSSVGSYGSISSSTDGTNFTLQPRTVYIVCQGAEYINSKYFQWGNEGLVISDDGINYRYLSGNYSAVASSGVGNYVGAGTVSSAGVLWKSSDFSTWSDKTPALLAPLSGIVYSGSEYLGVGERTVVRSVDNGNTWSQMSMSKTFTGLAYGSSKYVAAGYDADTWAAEISTSTDGTTWNIVNSTNNWYFKVKHINNSFFALGYDNDTYAGIVMYSADGTSWTNITPSLPFSTNYFNDVVFDGTKYYLFGTATDYSFFSVSTTTPTSTNSWGNQGVVTGVPVGVVIGGSWGDGAFAYSNGKFAGSVIDVATGEAYTLYSSNGMNWTAVATGENGSIASVIPEGSKFKMGGFGNLMITADFSLVTLPVKLTAFTGTLVNGNSVLQWKTSIEQNSSHFRVQHSTNQATWSDIGTVKAAGESNTLKQYNFTHTQPAAGDNYYRLIQVDLDGKEEISNTVKVKVGFSATVKLYPNPATDNVTVELPKQMSSSVIIYDAAGQQVSHNRYTGNIIRIPLRTLPAGTYKMTISQDGKQFTKQLIKY